MTDLPRAPVDRFEAAEDVLTDALEREEAPVARKIGGREALFGRIAGSRELATVVVCLLLFAFFTIGNPKYASVDIFLGIARRIALIGILAVPMTYLMIAGELDLSAGANLTFSSVLFAELASQEHRDPWLSMVLVLLAGAAIGAINGLLTVRVGLSSFIATLAMLAALQGGAEVLTESIYGSLVGTIIIGIITTGLVLLGLSQYFGDVATGVLIAATGALDLWVRRAASRSLSILEG